MSGSALTDQQRPWLTPVIRACLFTVLAFAGMIVGGALLFPLGTLLAATLSVFGAGAVASTVLLRIYEAGRLQLIGFMWHAAAARHFWFGVALGAAGIAFIIGIPLLAEKAYYVATPNTPFNPGSLLLVSACLLFGAIGEELLFRGYAFQVLAGAFGTYKVLLPVSVLFAAAHAGNTAASTVGLFNTFLWGVLLGYALLRSGDLWLPIGLHFGWNVTMPLFGLKLSGFTMGLTGYAVEWKASDLWSGGEYGPEGSLLTTLAVLGIGYLLHRVPINRQQLPLLLEE